MDWLICGIVLISCRALCRWHPIEDFRKNADHFIVMRYLILLLVAGVLSTMSCKDLKDRQLDAFVGDSQTKVVYKNVGKNTTIVPEARRVGFRSQSEAIDQGFTPENMAGDGGSSEE
jgi:hypothetical protein